MLSNSASSAVTSPWINGSGLVLPSVATETLTLDPILTPDLVITSRPGSRNRNRNRSGRCRLSSTCAEISSAFASAASGDPSMSTRNPELVGAIGYATGSASSAALGSISTLPSGIRSGSSTRLNVASGRQSVGSPYSR